MAGAGVMTTRAEQAARRNSRQKCADIPQGLCVGAPPSHPSLAGLMAWPAGGNPALVLLSQMLWGCYKGRRSLDRVPEEAKKLGGFKARRGGVGWGMFQE